MSYQQLLVVFIVTFWASALDEANLPCSASSNIIPEVFWPELDNGTCSTSVPSCTTPEGFLEIRCCIEGKPTEVNCKKNDTLKDPRCLGNMRSTMGSSDIKLCYEFVNHTTYPFECATKTGLMMIPNFEILSTLAGSNIGVWLPIEKFGNTFRYSTINSFYMESFGNQSSLHSSGSCMILIRGVTEVVSCEEHHLGICLDFPFIIYQLPESKLDDLLFIVKDSCFNSEHDDDFCFYFKQRYDMNLLYFSSRSNVEEPYIILQKSNSRFILQIRKNDIPISDGIINLHVALMSSDWDIFMNTSFPLKFYDAADENIYKSPKVSISAQLDVTNISIKKINPDNIKWTQKEEYTQYIYCFFSDAPNYRLQKFEALNEFHFDYENKDGVLWCEAFDFDLNVLRSNVITVGVQTVYHFISEMTVILKKVKSCDTHTIRVRIVNSFLLCKNDEKFFFDIRNLTVFECGLDKVAKVDILVFWYLEHPALRIDSVEMEYSELQIVIEDISKECVRADLNISSLHFINHSDYCLGETTTIGNFSFAWQTTPNNSQAFSYPFCYYQSHNNTFILQRSCLKTPLGSIWSTITENCEPTSDLTQLLEIYSNEKFGQTGILYNLNVIIQKYYENFHVTDLFLLSKIINKLKRIPSNIDKGLESLSLLVNNLHFIRKDVLKQSQDKYQTTDSIMNSSDYLYVSSRESKNLTESNHCYYSINFTENPNATGVILRSSGKNRQIKLLESMILPLELMKDDSFEAAIYLDEEFLNRSRKYENITTLKFSIFFNNYLFDVNHPLVSARTIFKLLLPDQIEPQPFTSFLTMKHQNKSEICSCWKYADIQNGIPESKWYRSTKFAFDSHSICVIKSAAYCTIINSESEDTSGYISRLSVEYSNSEFINSDATIFVYEVISNLLDQIQFRLLDKMTYEFEHQTNMDATPTKHEIVVVWIPFRPSRNIAELERGYNDLKHAIQESARRLLSNKYIDRMMVEYLRHKKYCMIDLYEYKNSTIIFETTPLNKTTISLPPCYTSKGMFHRKCIGNYDVGSYWEQLNNPPFVNCSSNVTEILDFLLTHFQDKDANDVLNSLKEMTDKSGEDFNSRDIFLLSEILFLMSNSTENLDSKNLTALTSNIQDIDKHVLKDAQNKFNATDQILYSLDRILLNSDITENKEKNFFTVELRPLNESVGVVIQRYGRDYNISMIDGASNLQDELSNFNNFESAVFFNGFNREESIVVSIFFQDVLFVDSTWRHSVSLVFGILLPHQKNTSEIHGEIELVFKNNESNDKACAFWKYGMENGIKISGRWKNESEPSNKPKFSTCKFNHTTHFAMLIDDGGDDPEYLRIITNIGCLLSLIGFLGILLTGVIFERWRKNLGNIILMNFVFTVIFQICLYYFSGFIHGVISRSESCIIVGALLHYSVLSEFCWMLIIASLQFKRFVQVLTGPPKYVLMKSFVVGWGLPLIPVLSVLLIDSSNYSYSKTGLCYPSKSALYLGVWLPILVITLINFVIFSYIMFSICNRKTECVDTVSNEIIFQWRLAVLLFFMLGLTWSFAFLGEFMLKDIFLYLFCITSTLQGFIMFLFFIVFNERTRLLYSTLFKRY